MLKKLKVLSLSAMAALAASAPLLPLAAHAQTASDIIPAASTTEIITGVVTNGWVTFAAIIGIIAGVVIIVGLVWMGIRKIYGAMTGHGRM